VELPVLSKLVELFIADIPALVKDARHENPIFCGKEEDDMALMLHTF